MESAFGVDIRHQLRKVRLVGIVVYVTTRVTGSDVTR